MTHDNTTARRAVSAVALLAAAGLALTGCKSSTSASGGGGSAGTGGSSASASTGSSGGSTGHDTSSGGGTPYFPAAVGDTWVYTDSVEGTHATVTNKVTKVVSVSGGQRVTMRTVDTATAGATQTFTYIFHSDGSITIPFNEFGNEGVKLTSGSISWPSEADLASGQTRKSTLSFEITAAGKVQHVHAHVTVKGGGTQSVTVPAGTYQAQVIDETMSEKFDGVTVNLTVRTWLATGVGPVKDELLSSSSVPSTIEELKSFTKG